MRGWPKPPRGKTELLNTCLFFLLPWALEGTTSLAMASRYRNATSLFITSSPKPSVPLCQGKWHSGTGRSLLCVWGMNLTPTSEANRTYGSHGIGMSIWPPSSTPSTLGSDPGFLGEEWPCWRSVSWLSQGSGGIEGFLLKWYAQLSLNKAPNRTQLSY
jgi:hypothetical protein